jgi:hypothetical protein
MTEESNSKSEPEEIAVPATPKGTREAAQAYLAQFQDHPNQPERKIIDRSWQFPDHPNQPPK